MQASRKKLKDEVQPAGLEKRRSTNNINEIILRMVKVQVLPKNTGIVSCPINLSLWISKISDIAERIKTIPKVKPKATIKPA